MGYEIVYHYYKKAEKGYNVEERFTTSGKVGDPFEDITLEQLATVIMGQYARRDIMVDEVEVYELKKLKITCRESPGGLILKNKKFNLDLCSKNIQSTEVIELGSGEVENVQPHNQVQQQPHNVVKPVEEVKAAVQTVPKPVTMVNGKPKLKGQSPIRHETFQPEDFFLKQYKDMKMAFTIGKTYPIFSERIHPNDALLLMLYTTINDKGVQQELADKFFVPNAEVILSNGFKNTVNPTVVGGQDDLWGNIDIVNEEIPELRRN